MIPYLIVYGYRAAHFTGRALTWALTWALVGPLILALALAERLREGRQK